MSTEAQIPIRVQGTPNPRSMKFLTERTLLPMGSADFRDPQSALGSPLARRVFDVDSVEGVFVSQNLVTVTADENGDWEKMVPSVSEAIREFLRTGEAAVPGGHEGHAEGQGEVVDHIKEILDQQIRPAVAGDGGDVVFVEYTDGIVYLKMQGACGGCPSATMTLKQGIEARLRHFIPEIQSVEAVL